MPQQIDVSERSDRDALWQDLIGRIADGDEAAFAQLYDQTHSPVYGLALRIVSLPSVAEEVTMDVYLQVWREASRYRQSRGAVFGWLMMLARSRALDRLRHERRSPVYHAVDFDEGHDVVDLGHSPLSLVQVKQVKSKVTEVFHELSSEQQRVVQLSFYDGLSHGEIAEKLQLPLGTVKTRIRSALGKFKQVLA